MIYHRKGIARRLNYIKKIANLYRWVVNMYVARSELSGQDVENYSFKRKGGLYNACAFCQTNFLWFKYLKEGKTVVYNNQLKLYLLSKFATFELTKSVEDRWLLCIYVILGWWLQPRRHKSSLKSFSTSFSLQDVPVPCRSYKHKWSKFSLLLHK